MNELNHQKFAASHGVLNSNASFYQHGKSYGMDTKLFMAMKYLKHNARLGELRPVLMEVAVECHVGRHFVAKVERELMENDCVLSPEEILMGRDNPIVPGSKSMSCEDFYVFYILYRQEPKQSLKSYVYWLYYYTVTIMSDLVGNVGCRHVGQTP